MQKSAYDAFSRFSIWVMQNVVKLIERQITDIISPQAVSGLHFQLLFIKCPVLSQKSEINN